MGTETDGAAASLFELILSGMHLENGSQAKLPAVFKVLEFFVLFCLLTKWNWICMDLLCPRQEITIISGPSIWSKWFHTIMKPQFVSSPVTVHSKQSTAPSFTIVPCVWGCQVGTSHDDGFFQTLKSQWMWLCSLAVPPTPVASSLEAQTPIESQSRTLCWATQVSHLAKLLTCLFSYVLVLAERQHSKKVASQHVHNGSNWQ